MDTRSGHDKLLTWCRLSGFFLENAETLMPLLIDTGLELTKQLRNEDCNELECGYRLSNGTAQVTLSPLPPRHEIPRPQGLF